MLGVFLALLIGLAFLLGLVAICFAFLQRRWGFLLAASLVWISFAFKVANIASTSRMLWSLTADHLQSVAVDGEKIEDPDKLKRLVLALNEANWHDFNEIKVSFGTRLVFYYKDGTTAQCLAAFGMQKREAEINGACSCPKLFDAICEAGIPLPSYAHWTAVDDTFGFDSTTLRTGANTTSLWVQLPRDQDFPGIYRATLADDGKLMLQCRYMDGNPQGRTYESLDGKFGTPTQPAAQKVVALMQDLSKKAAKPPAR